MRVKYFGCDHKDGEHPSEDERNRETFELTQRIVRKLRKTFSKEIIPMRHHPALPAIITSTAVSFFVGLIEPVAGGFTTLEKRNRYFDKLEGSFKEIFKELREKPYEEHEED